MLQCSLCFLDVRFSWLNLDMLYAFYWQNNRHPNIIIFFLLPQFAPRQLPFSAIECSLLNSCTLALHTTCRLCACAYLSTPASLVAVYWCTQHSACGSGKTGSDAVGQAKGSWLVDKD